MPSQYLNAQVRIGDLPSQRQTATNTPVRPRSITAAHPVGDSEVYEKTHRVWL